VHELVSRLGIIDKKLEAEPVRFLNTEKDASLGYHNRRTVAKAFLLAIDEAAKVHPAAEPLIKYASLLTSEPIRLYLFSEGREEFSEPLLSLTDGEGLDDAVGALRAFALVDRELISDERDPSITTDCIRLHRLIQQVAAARCTVDDREDSRRQLLAAIAKVYPYEIFRCPHGNLSNPSESPFKLSGNPIPSSGVSKMMNVAVLAPLS